MWVPSSPLQGFSPPWAHTLNPGSLADAGWPGLTWGNWSDLHSASDCLTSDTVPFTQPRPHLGAWGILSFILVMYKECTQSRHWIDNLFKEKKTPGKTKQNKNLIDTYSVKGKIETYLLIQAFKKKNLFFGEWRLIWNQNILV